MVCFAIVLILLMKQNLQVSSSGFDAYTSCYRTSRKRPDIPCDFEKQTWCNIPGSAYPWHAVRRFVHENQGLMRRMYGQERHISVLRAELEENEVEYYNDAKVREEFRMRYSKDMDGSSDFVKILVSNDARKASQRSTSKSDKSQKSIDEKSSNVLFQNHFKADEGVYKSNFLNSFGSSNKTTLLVSTTTVEVSTGASNATVRFNVTTPATTPMTSSEVPSTTIPTTVSTTAQPDSSYNFTNTTSLPNDTQIEDEMDYVSETEETLTTTGADALTTTDEFDFEDEESQGEGEEGYEDGAEEGDMEAQEVAEEPVTQKAPPILRLKGINACPVKEEVVAPFWANNTRGEVLALLNLYPFEQYVHWEKCTYEHKQMFCRDGCRCEQQYRLHRLLAYDPNNECRGIFSDWFRFPSCCVCKCYDLPMEFRLTSRSPRFQTNNFFSRITKPRQPAT